MSPIASVLLTLSPPRVTPFQNKKLDHLLQLFLSTFRNVAIFSAQRRAACRGLLCLMLGFLLRPYEVRGGRAPGLRC